MWNLHHVFCSSVVWDTESCKTLTMWLRQESLLGVLMLNYFRILSICIFGFSPSTSSKNYFQWSPNSCQEIYIISNQQCVKHIKFLEILLWSHLLSCKHKHLHYPLMKSNSFDYSIKMKIPSPFCSLLSIVGTLKFAYLLASSGSTNYFGLYHIQVLGFISIRWKSFCHPCFISQHY